MAAQEANNAEEMKNEIMRLRQQISDMEAAAVTEEQSSAFVYSQAARVTPSNAEALSVLARGIAHDFNNLLTAIVGNVGLAQMSLYSNEVEKARLALVDVESAALRARNLTQQLLTLSGGGAPIKEIFSIETLLYEAIAFALGGSKRRCQVEAESIWPVDADRAQIMQVMNNLLLNADQAMLGSGRIVVRAQNVTLEAKNPMGLEPGSYVSVAVQDQGSGVSPEIVGKIFEPFFTTKHRRSGLGLSSAKAIIKEHHGHIGVESIPGEGSTFTFYIPAKPGASVREEAMPRFHGLTRPLRILVMDDEELLRDMLYQLLSAFGHSVVAVADGREAISEYESALLSGERYDLAILDLTVPGGLGGQEALRLMLEIDPAIKAVASSGYATDPVMIHCNDYGFVSKLTKPYSLSELRRTLYTIFQEDLGSQRTNVVGNEACHRSM